MQDSKYQSLKSLKLNLKQDISGPLTNCTEKVITSHQRDFCSCFLSWNKITDKEVRHISSDHDDENT